MTFKIKVANFRVLTDPQKKELGIVPQFDRWGDEILYHDSEFVWPIRTFDTLEDLMGFVKKWKTVVLTVDTIEIYNGYRE